MRSKYRYHGFYYQNETYADNRLFYQAILDRPEDHSSKSRKLARKKIAFYTRFDPTLPHNRLVGHKVTVYLVNNPIWMGSSENLQVRIGDLEEIVSLDLGAILVPKSTGQDYFREELVKRGVTEKLPDGTYIRGDQFRRILVSPEGNLEKFAELVDLELDLNKQGYGFRLKKPSDSKPLQFNILSYVQFDGITVEEKKEVARVGLRTIKGKTERISYFSSELRPRKSICWVYGKKQE